MNGAFDRACWIGPAQAAALPSPSVCDGLLSCCNVAVCFAERVCQAVCRGNGKAPLWLRYVRRDILLPILAYGGCAEACGGLATSPFSFGPQEGQSGGAAALYWASRNGHVAVIDRLAAPRSRCDGRTREATATRRCKRRHGTGTSPSSTDWLRRLSLCNGRTQLANTT